MEGDVTCSAVVGAELKATSAGVDALLAAASTINDAFLRPGDCVRVKNGAHAGCMGTVMKIIGEAVLISKVMVDPRALVVVDMYSCEDLEPVS